MRGDFVLYEGKPGNFADWLIIHFSGGGPYVHCEIDLGNGLFVGEHGQGITVHKMDHTIKSDFVTPKSKEGQKGIDLGMQWLNKVIAEAQKDQNSHRYGWLDIAVDVARIFGARLTLQRTGAWDCSHFVTLYLQVADADWPLGRLTQEPETVSPNDLARAYGVIK